MKALLLLLLTPLSMFGQSVSTVLGGSQLMGVAGVQTSYQYNGRFGWTGVGYYNGFKFAGYMNMPLRMFTFEDTSRDRYRLGIGNQDLNASVATDESDYRKAMVRGGSLLRHTENSDLQVFVGNFSLQDMQPYLYSTHQINPDWIGAIVERTRLSKTLTLQSFNLFGSSNSSIQSLAWTPRPTWHLSTAGGIGGNHLYFANAADFHKKRLDLRASYTLANSNFRRQDGDYNLEPLGFNAKAEIPIGERTIIHFNHRRELTTIPNYLGYQITSSLGTIDLASVTTSFFGFRVGASVDRASSSTFVGKNHIGLASISRNILPRWKSTFSYLHNVATSQDFQVYQDTNQFRVSNHLSLSHNLVATNGNLTNTLGGKWSSNPLSFSVDNQVYVSPVAAQFGQKSVFQAWNFSIRFRTPHGTTTHLETIVDPFGKAQWGGYLTGLQYHGLGTYSSSEMQHVNFSKYVIKGTVVDESGKGVWGIALIIGGDMVMSDTDGSFFVHVKNQKPVPFAVAAGSSLQSLRWSLVSAPASAQGFLEDKSGAPVRVVVQVAGHVPVQKSAPNVATQPQPKATVPATNDQVNDLPTARPVAVQKPAPALMIEPQLNATVISVNDQVRDLQRAEKELIAVTAPHSEKHLNVHHAGNRSRVLRVLCCLVCFGWHGRMHRGTEDAAEGRA